MYSQYNYMHLNLFVLLFFGNSSGFLELCSALEWLCDKVKLFPLVFYVTRKGHGCCNKLEQEPLFQQCFIYDYKIVMYIKDFFHSSVDCRGLFTRCHKTSLRTNRFACMISFLIKTSSRAAPFYLLRFYYVLKNVPKTNYPAHGLYASYAFTVSHYSICK